MKINSKTAIIVLFGCLLQPASLLAQGSLTPPGAPTPTMKTADQIYAKLDPRIPVSTNTTPGDGFANEFIISKPGSYYLTTNIVGIASENGIEILASNVVLDLNGFTIQGVPPVEESDLGIVADSGIYIDVFDNITVRNGIITGWPSYFAGVASPGESSQNIVFERLTVDGSYNGGGILIGGSGVVRDCNCLNNYGNGIECDGGGLVTGCTGNNNNTGIHAQSDHQACIVSGCVAQNNLTGISVSPGSVSGCLVQNNTVCGIVVTGDGSRIIGNDCLANNGSNTSGGAGIVIGANNNQVEGNRVTRGNGGILVNSGNVKNVIIKNSAAVSAGVNYSVPAGNDLGPVGTAATSTSPWANISN